MKERGCEVNPQLTPKGFKEVLRQLLPDGGLKQMFVRKGRKRFEPPEANLVLIERQLNEYLEDRARRQ